MQVLDLAPNLPDELGIIEGCVVARSEKTLVIQRIWEVLQSEIPPRRVALKIDVQEAIRWCAENRGTKLDDGNAPNFMKDFLRGERSSDNWPRELADLRISGRQVIGDQRVMEFIDYKEGQDEPFPPDVEPDPNMEPVSLQSVSLPLATKSLGRTDESWLIQVAVNLRVLEQHFALQSPLKVREVTHLQVAVKLGGRSEIDSLFLAVVELDGENVNALVTCEAKQGRDRILKDQIVQQVVAAHAMVARLGLSVSIVIPVAIKAVPPKGDIFIAEFEHWTKEDTSAAEADLKSLELVSSALYRLTPPVTGVGYNPPAKRRKAAKPAV
jgi:hypothetical protein